ncbi:diguanylate cyclase domain-containing protein [Thermomonas paludicola]|uniref:diguanylate cyclase domain-containing protein n=1 Tax=Thermomonas paludicola TaxID=2884874 RepID=UPI0021143BC7|nr:transporter substrate-binding domain-containing protein [Thermomonas paludicola]
MKFIRFYAFFLLLTIAPFLVQADVPSTQKAPHDSENKTEMSFTSDQQAWLAAHPVIRVGVDPDFAPYEWLDKSGNYVGIAVDYLQHLEKAMGVRFEIVRDKTWSESQDMAKRGELDMLSSMVKTPERSQYMIFTEPYRETQLIIIDNGQGGFIGDLTHLTGKRVALETGYFAKELLEKNYPKINLVFADNTYDALLLVEDGKADAYVGDAGAANYVIKKHDLLNLRFSGQTEYTSAQSFAVTKNNAELAAILSKIMGSMSREESEAIFNRWLGMRIEQGIETKTLIQYGAGFAALFLLFGYWVFRLRREIGYRKAAEMREHSRNSILEMLAKAAPLPAILETIERSVEQQYSNLQCRISMHDAQAQQSPHTATTGAATHDTAPSPSGVRSTQAIQAASGEILGTLSLYSHAANTMVVPKTESNMFSDAILIEQFTHLAGIAIEKWNSAEKLRHSEAHYRQLTEGASDIIWKTDSDLRVTYISLADERLRGYRADEVIGRHIFEMFTEEGVATVTELMRQRQEAEQCGVPSGPVTFEVQQRCKDGRLIWAEVLSKPERDEHGTIVGFHGVTRETTERKQMQDQVRQLAFFDPLTRLPNRRLLNDRLGQVMTASKRSACHGALMILDLDNFKHLNDTQGHLVGDLLLIEVARRLTCCVRAMDTVARFGGDEFVVLLSDLNADEKASALQARLVAEKIRSSLSEPYLLTVKHPGQADTIVEHCCSASIGVVIFIGNENTQDDMLKWADAAMYQAKAAGRNLIQLYDEKPE